MQAQVRSQLSVLRDGRRLGNQHVDTILDRTLSVTGGSCAQRKRPMHRSARSRQANHRRKRLKVRFWPEAGRAPQTTKPWGGKQRGESLHDPNELQPRITLLPTLTSPIASAPATALTPPKCNECRTFAHQSTLGLPPSSQK